MPDPTRIYVMGVDVAEGAGTKHGDSSAIEVLDAETLQQVAEYQSTAHTPDEFAGVVARLGRFYGGAIGEAFTVVENGIHGDITLKDLQQVYAYRNLYAERRGEGPAKSLAAHRVMLGFKQTHSSRQDLIDRARQNFRELTSKEYLAKFGPPILSNTLIDQIQAFRYEESDSGGLGKPKAEKKGHDDLVIAWCLALRGAAEARKRRPQPEVERPRSTEGHLVEGEREAWIDRRMREVGRRSWRRDLEVQREIEQAFRGTF